MRRDAACVNYGVQLALRPLPLRRPMLLRPGAIPPVGDSWTLEIKLDGFRAIVSTRMDCAYAVARLGDVFEDGNVLFDAVVAHGVEGIVAKRLTGVYRPG
jgi:ATP-dependent DNA ligase